MHKSKNPNFSFSGLKTAFNQIAMTNKLNKKIMKKIHPDRSPELNNIAKLVNQAKDTVVKSVS